MCVLLNLLYCMCVFVRAFVCVGGLVGQKTVHVYVNILNLQRWTGFLTDLSFVALVLVVYIYKQADLYSALVMYIYSANVIYKCSCDLYITLTINIVPF